MLTNDERARLRALEENLAREDPRLAARMRERHRWEPDARIPLWPLLLVVLGSFSGAVVIMVGAVHGWTPVAWLGAVIAVGVPILHHARSVRGH